MNIEISVIIRHIHWIVIVACKKCLKSCLIKQFLDGTMCENSGWGKTSTDPPVWPDELQVVTIPYVPQDVCKSIWENVGQTIYDGEICAGDLTTNKGPCNVTYP